MVRIRGGSARRHVSRHTSYLVIGDADRSRPRRNTRTLMDVERLGSVGQRVQVISESEFLKMLGLESACRLRDRYYSSQDVHRLYGFGNRTLRSLEHATLVSPILRTNAERYYTFSDLLLLKRVHASVRYGGSLARCVKRLLQTRAGQARLTLEAPESEVLPFVTEQDVTWSAEDWYNLGCDHDSDPDEMQEAVAAYRRALELDPYHVGALINLGNLTYDLGNIDEARRLYERALGCDPDNSIALFNLGNVYEDLGEYQRAIAYFQSAIRLRPDNVDAHFNLGLIYDRLGEVSSVREHMRQYLRLNPQGDMADVAREYMLLTEDGPEPTLV